MMIHQLLLYSLLILSHVIFHVSAATEKYTVHEAADVMHKIASMTGNIAENMVGSKEKAIQLLQNKQRDLITRFERGQISEKRFDIENKQVEAELQQAHEALKLCREKHTAMQNQVGNMVADAFKAGIEIERDKATRETRIIEAAATAREGKKAEMEGLVKLEETKGNHQMRRLQFLSDPENLKRYALFGTIATAGVAGSYFGVKVAANYIQDYLRPIPEIAEETSLMSVAGAWWDDLKGYVFTKPTVDFKSDIVLNKDVEMRLLAIAECVKSMHNAELELPSLLLYGPPGTGKTWFAKLLALNAGMDYVIMSADRFSQFAEGSDVEQMHQLFRWAENSPRGMIIFIDEIDALGASRDKLDQRWIRLQNAFLAHTGSLSHKFMIIGATNRPNALDKAFLDRFPERILVSLPNQEERIKLIQMYIDKKLRNDSRTVKVNGKKQQVALTVSNDVTPAAINDLAAMINGLSGRAIMQVISKVQRDAYKPGSSFVIHAATLTQAFKERLEDKTKQDGYNS